LTFFPKVKSPDPLIDAKLNSKNKFTKAVFRFFEPYMTNQKISHNNSIWVLKNAEFDADFEPVESWEESYWKKVIGFRTFAHSTKR
jgi:hypothetical protein